MYRYSLILLSILICGCFPKKFELGDKKIVDKSLKKRPLWTNELSYKTPEGLIFFVGSRLRSDSLEEAKRDAKSLAIAGMIDEAHIFFKKVYEETAEELEIPPDTSSTQFVLLQGIKALSELDTMNFIQGESYYEQYKELTSQGMSIFYDFYLSLGIREDNFKGIILNVIDNLLQQAILEENKVAEQLLMMMKAKVLMEQ